MRIAIGAVAVIAAIAAAGCASNSDLGLGPVNTAGPPSDFLSPAGSPAAGPAATPRHRHHHRRAQLAAVRPVRVHDPGQVTGTMTGTCHARDGGQLPDRRCNPGAYDPAVTKAVLCSGSYSTDTYRPPSSQTDAFKFSEAYPAYGIPSGTTSELDHLIPLELGGANDAANLWPEVGSLPNPKDHVENALHDAVCSGRVALGSAQRAIARNWETALQRLGISGGTAPSRRQLAAVMGAATRPRRAVTATSAASSAPRPSTARPAWPATARPSPASRSAAPGGGSKPAV